MKRIYWPLAVAMITVLVLTGCTRQPTPLDTGASTHAYTVPGPTTQSISVALIAGQTTNVGSVTCWLEGNVLHVDCATTGDWVLCETHLAVAASSEGIPTTPSGNPVPGQFPFKAVHTPCVSTFGYSVDLDALGLAGNDLLFVAVQASVKQLASGRTDGAWGQGTRFSLPAVEKDRVESRGKGNWGMYFTVNVAQLRGLLLWNKLGSQSEVNNSVVGPDGVIMGQIAYEPCTYGYGFMPLPRTGDHNYPNNLIDYPGLKLGAQGCIEFWYHPKWRDWQVGHIVELFWYGKATDIGQPATWTIAAQYNDWQGLLNVSVTNTDNSSAAWVPLIPGNLAGWSTTQPFHFALSWDGLAANPTDRVHVYINGSRVGATSYSGNPTFSDWSQDLVLRLGSRVYAGDWNRHNWEGVDGVIDNIKVWNYAKSDFSDRFHE